jgi:beta-lactam-binding protein with PASTA domain
LPNTRTSSRRLCHESPYVPTPESKGPYADLWKKNQEAQDYNPRVWRSLFRGLWMALVLALVALVSALTAMRFAIHGREVTVPDMQGRSPLESRQIADANGLGLKVERDYYSSKVPEGRVLSQVPAPGTVVRRGWEVRLALSLGPQRVAIPSVIGESERAAAITIAQRGLDLGSNAGLKVSGVAPGQVVGQNPPANATNVSAPKISLLVAEEPPRPAFVMPALSGQALGTVTAYLQSAGFALGKVSMAPASSAPGDNASQTTATGGPNSPPAASPSAIAPASTPSPGSIVVAQDPKAGEKVVAGSAINLVVR